MTQTGAGVFECHCLSQDAKWENEITSRGVCDIKKKEPENLPKKACSLTKRKYALSPDTVPAMHPQHPFDGRRHPSPL